MEFRVKEAACAAIVLSALPALAQEFRYPARHEHLRKGGAGTLTIDAVGVSFQEPGRKKPHAWKWSYADIQQLTVSPRQVRVLTYRDSRWKLGADREYRFDALAGREFRDAYAFLRERLDQRLVAELADGGAEPLWELPAKHLGRFGGTEGVLVVGKDRVVYNSDRAQDSRTWRYTDIDNISSSGPFQLTLTTFERARSHYGNRKGFNFQLKAPLDEARYNDLWRRLNERKGTLRLPELTKAE